jgi:hypothetical protein
MEKSGQELSPKSDPVVAAMADPVLTDAGSHLLL